jgi:hypothetical protein
MELPRACPHLRLRALRHRNSGAAGPSGRTQLAGAQHAALIDIPDDLASERFDPGTLPGWDAEIPPPRERTVTSGLPLRARPS